MEIKQNENLQEYIWDNYQPLFHKTAKKYMKNNLLYSYEDIINECYIISLKLAKNYKDLGEKSSMFGYINKYLGIQIHNLLTQKQIVKVDRNKFYKTKENLCSKVEYLEEISKKENLEISNIEYSKEEFYKLIEDKLNKNVIIKKEYDMLINYCKNENTKIYKGINKIIKKISKDI